MKDLANGNSHQHEAVNQNNLASEDEFDDDDADNGPYRDEKPEDDQAFNLRSGLYHADRYGPMPSPSDFDDKNSANLSASQEQLEGSEGANHEG